MSRIMRAAALLAAVAMAAGALPAAAAAPGWTVALAPAPPHSGTTTFGDIDCVTANFCVQVGTAVRLTTHASSAVAVIHRGSHVSASELALPIDAERPDTSAGLNAVDCVSASYCVAVGGYTTYDGRGRELIETYRNGRWTGSSVPGQTGFGAGLYDVACNVSSCVATGSYYNGFNSQPVIAVRNSTGVWADPTILNATYFLNVQSPVCPPQGSCYAQGYEYPGPGSSLQRTRFLYPTASGWSGSYFPMPAGADEHTLTIGTMACPSDEFCTGVGTYQDAATGADHLVAENFSQGRLSVHRIKTPAATARPKGYLEPTATSCGSVAAGVPCAAAVNPSGAGKSVYVEFSEGRWSAQPAPEPVHADTNSVRIAAVSCTARGACSAVGMYHVAGARRPLVQQRSTSGWQQVPLSVPAGVSRAGITFDALSCVAGTCEASGDWAGFPTRKDPDHLLYATN